MKQATGKFYCVNLEKVIVWKFKAMEKKLAFQ